MGPQEGERPTYVSTLVALDTDRNKLCPRSVISLTHQLNFGRRNSVKNQLSTLHR
jgi:hypothetical protein